MGRKGTCEDCGKVDTWLNDTVKELATKWAHYHGGTGEHGGIFWLCEECRKKILQSCKECCELFPLTELNHYLGPKGGSFSCKPCTEERNRLRDLAWTAHLALRDKLEASYPVFTAKDVKIPN